MFKLSKYCGLAIAGALEAAAKIIDELSGVLKRRSIQFTDEILEETRRLARTRYDDWFAKFSVQERPALALMLVGYHSPTPDNFIPRTYFLASQTDFAQQLFPNGIGLGGVPQYAIYLMNRLYQPEMTVDNTARLAAYLIVETATQGPKVGGPIRIATIKPQEGYQELDRDTVDEIISRNNEQNKKLKQFFF